MINAQFLRRFLLEPDPAALCDQARALSMCTLLFNVEMLRTRDSWDCGRIADEALADYFTAAGLVGRRHPLAHCAMFRGDVLPQHAFAIASMIGLPPNLPLLAFAFVGATDHDWSPLSASAWSSEPLAEYCFNAFVTNDWIPLLPTLHRPGYFSATGQLVRMS